MNENCCIFNSQAWESEAWKGALMCVSGCRRLSFPGCRASRSKHRKQSTEVRAKAIAPTWSQGCSLLHCEVGLWGGMCVGLDEIVMWGTHKGVSVLWEETKTSLHRSLPPSLSLSLSPSLPLSPSLSFSLSLRPSPPCVHTAKRWLSASQEEGPHQELNLPAAWSWTSQPPETLEINAWSLNLPVYGIFYEVNSLKQLCLHRCVLVIMMY